jgi:WD domain, G-beta repeat.
LESGKKREEFTLNRHNSIVYCAVISQDGKFLITGSDNSKIKVWNLEERRVYFKWS